MSVRAYASTYYDQDFISDADWSELRKACLSDHNDDPEFEDLLRITAWFKTDPQAFVTLIDRIDRDIQTFPTHIKWQYVASSILTDRNEKNLKDLMPDEIDEENFIYHFAHALWMYASEDESKRLQAVKDARQAYLTNHGSVPAEEEAIFSAIENKTPLPELRWKKLNSTFVR